MKKTQRRLQTRGWRPEAADKLQARGCRPEAGGQRLQTRGWRPEAAEKRLQAKGCTRHYEKDPKEAADQRLEERFGSSKVW